MASARYDGMEILVFHSIVGGRWDEAHVEMPWHVLILTVPAETGGFDAFAAILAIAALVVNVRC